MANITKNQARARVKQQRGLIQLSADSLRNEADEMRNAAEELRTLAEEMREEADYIEPYENRDDLTEQQEERQEWLNEQLQAKHDQLEALKYAQYLTTKKQKEASDMVRDCPQNIYIKEWQSEEKRLSHFCDILGDIQSATNKDFVKLCKECQELEKNPNKAKYYDTFWGFKVSDYALEYGRLDYATMSKCFDAVLYNNIAEIDPYIFDNLESGDYWKYYDEEGEEIDREKYDELIDQGKDAEERAKDIFQWFIVSPNALDILKEAGELVLYSSVLDCYIWGVDHWGTSWDYVLTNIKLRERED